MTNPKKIFITLGMATALIIPCIQTIPDVFAETQDTQPVEETVSESETQVEAEETATEDAEENIELEPSDSVNSTNSAADEQEPVPIENPEETVTEQLETEPVVQQLEQETANHFASLLGLNSEETTAYSISLQNEENEEIRTVEDPKKVTIPAENADSQKELWIFHLLDSVEAIQNAYSNGKLFLGTTVQDDPQLLKEIDSCEEFMTDSNYEDEDGNRAGNRNVFAYTIMTENDDEVQLNEDSVTFETSSFSNFVFSWDNISNAWRAGGQPLSNYVNRNVGNVLVKANTAISAYYNFKLGGNTSSQQLRYANWAWYGNSNAGGYGGWTTTNMNNNGILTSYTYDVSSFANETPISTGQIYCTYPNVGKYNGKMVDARLSVTKFGRNAAESGAKPPLIGFSKDTIAVNVLGIDYVEITYEFFEAGTNTPVSVKGNTTYTDIDYLQGIMIHNSCDGIYVSTTDPYPLMGSVYASTVNGVPYIYDCADITSDGNSYKDTESLKAAFTEIFSGTSLVRTYTFARRADRLGRGGIANEAQPVNLPANGAILSVSKAVVGANNDDEFDFTVKITDQTGRSATSGRYGSVSINSNGEGSFKLKGGETTTIEGLYPSYTVIVTEQGSPDYSASVNGQESRTFTYHVTDSMEIEKADFINTFSPHMLTVKKLVTGDMGNKTQSFDFTLQLTDRYKNKSIATDRGAVLNTDENGIVHFSLRHDESITFTGLSTSDIIAMKQNFNYGVEENKAYKQQGYYTKYEVNDKDTSNVVITVTNDRTAGVPTVVPSDTKSDMVFVGGCAVLILFLAVSYYCKKYSKY